MRNKRIFKIAVILKSIIKETAEQAILHIGHHILNLSRGT